MISPLLKSYNSSITFIKTKENNTTYNISIVERCVNMESIETKRANRFLFLKSIYEASQRDTMNGVNMWEVGNELGWDEKITDDIVEYLLEEELIKEWSHGGEIGITHKGIREVEDAISKPQEPPQHSPTVINIIAEVISGSNININSELSNASQIINALPEKFTSNKHQIAILVSNLMDTLQQVPAENNQEVETIIRLVKEALKSLEDHKFNTVKIKIITNSLLEVAKHINVIKPTVLPIVQQFIDWITQFLDQEKT